MLKPALDQKGLRRKGRGFKACLFQIVETCPGSKGIATNLAKDLF